MTITEKIQANNNRVVVFWACGEAMNTCIINKRIRKNRALAKQK